MVIGNGLIAKAFEQYANNPDVTIFASGVSDSACSDYVEFNRERILLNTAIQLARGAKIVYFSSATDKHSPYFLHKRSIEVTLSLYNNHLIIRLPQVVGNGGNPYNLFNFIKKKLINNEEITVWRGALRSLVDIDDVKRVTDSLISKDKIGVFCFNGIEFIEVETIVEMMAKKLNLTPRIKIFENCSYVKMVNDLAIANALGETPENYTQKLIDKYL